MVKYNGIDTETSDGSAESELPKQRLAKRLREVGYDFDLAIQGEPGEKRPKKGIRWKDERNHYSLEEVGSHYLIIPKGNLVIIDLDYFHEGIAAPAFIENLPHTFTVITAHGGQHLYYLYDGYLGNAERDWGGIHAENKLAFGPGSELEQCNKDDHDCSLPGEGQYGILRNLRIATLSEGIAEELRDLLGMDSRKGDRENISSVTEIDIDLSNVDDDIDEIEEINAPFNDLKFRFELFLDDDRRKALWGGYYSQVGYENNRSRAEWLLATFLAYWFEADLNVVAQLMNVACNRREWTDEQTMRKWVTRNDDSYRNAILTLPCAKDEFETFDPSDYNEPSAPVQSFDDLPDVSYVTKLKIQEAIKEIGPATEKEIADHPFTDRSPSQTNEALREMVNETSVIDRRKDRSQLYNPYVYFLTYPDGVFGSHDADDGQ